MDVRANGLPQNQRGHSSCQSRVTALGQPVRVPAHGDPAAHGSETCHTPGAAEDLRGVSRPEHRASRPQQQNTVGSNCEPKIVLEAQRKNESVSEGF